MPRIGWVKCREQLPAVSPKNVVISRQADRWFIAFRYEVQPQQTKKKVPIVGVDLGSRKLATLSTGEMFENPKAFAHKMNLLRRVQKKFSRQVKGSNNREKTRLRLARLHYRVACIRRDAIHKLTTYLAKNHGVGVIEDLNVRGMLKNRRLARTIADIGFYEVRRQLEYKCELYGSQLVVVDRWYPSSKKCSRCGPIHKGLGSSEVFICPACGFGPIDRDLQAAINLVQAVSPTVSACGCSSDGGMSIRQSTSHEQMKQEAGTGSLLLGKSSRLA